MADHQQRGFTLFELIVVICLVSTLATVAFDRLRYYQEAAEMAAAESNLQILKGALAIRSGELIAANRWAEFRQLARTNPFDWLEEKPANYGGVAGAGATPGKWYFDEAGRRVVYRVARGEGFTASDGGQEMRFILEGRDVSGRVVEGGGMASVRLRAEAEYRWQDRVFR